MENDDLFTARDKYHGCWGLGDAKNCGMRYMIIYLAIFRFQHENGWTTEISIISSIIRFSCLGRELNIILRLGDMDVLFSRVPFI